MNDFYDNAYALMDMLEQDMSYEDMFEMLMNMEAGMLDNNDNDISRERGDMSKILRVETDDELDKHFNGILIEVSDIAGTYHVPGWECKTCGWKVGALSFPPSHTCPDAGIKQKQLRMKNGKK